MDLFKKCDVTVKEVNRAHDLGIYPFFTPIESVQDHRVIVDGKEFIMIGSNGYLGLAADSATRVVRIGEPGYAYGGRDGDMVFFWLLSGHLACRVAECAVGAI